MTSRINTLHTETTNSADLSFLRRSDVERMVGLSKTTIWRLEKAGKFPRHIQLTERSVAYRKSEVLDWLRNPINFNSTN
jgi:predicted DNA-binding transcriptional regulator AlpA